MYLHNVPVSGTVMGIFSKDLKSEIKLKQFEMSFHKILQFIVYRALRPWFYSETILSFFPVHREIKKQLNFLTGYVMDVIAKRKTFLSNKEEHENGTGDSHYNSTKRKILMDVLLSASEDKNVMDDNGIFGEAVTFVLAGHETTAVTLGFLLMLLANNKDAQVYFP